MKTQDVNFLFLFSNRNIAAYKTVQLSKATNLSWLLPLIQAHTTSILEIVHILMLNLSLQALLLVAREKL